MQLKLLKTELALSGAAFFASYALSLFKAYIPSSAVLIACAVFIFLWHIKKSGRLLDPAAIFALSWIGGVGVSALKLSDLQTDWSVYSWASFYLCYGWFITAYELALKEKTAETDDAKTAGTCGAKPCTAAYGCDIRNRGLLSVINIVTLISLAALTAEICILKYVPLFTEDTPHAYSYFHVSGLHYFTVSCVLVPALIVIYYRCCRDIIKNDGAVRANLTVCACVSLIIPVLLVSRYQLIFAAALAGFSYLAVNDGRIKTRPDKKKVLAVCAAFVSLVAAYVFITYERAHSIEYLNGIFEMKNEGLPIFFSQPYIYIANNFDNFNCLTSELTGHTHGLRMLFPVFALTGLKFVYPELCSFPIYVTKEELTTVTLIYDAYYDFGMVGVMAFSAVLGFIAARLYKKANGTDGGPVTAFIFAQLCFYLMFSFFTTWFSNPTTWFYIIASAGIGIYLNVYRKIFTHTTSA